MPNFVKCFGNTVLRVNYFRYSKTLRKVVLNVQTSGWRKINSGVQQGQVSGPLLFLTYIHDLPDIITLIYKIFADDTY